MGATPMVGGDREGRTTPRGRPKERVVAGTPAESGAWGYCVHPSLLPTIFAPSGDVPASEPVKQPTARKV